MLVVFVVVVVVVLFLYTFQKMKENLHKALEDSLLFSLYNFTITVHWLHYLFIVSITNISPSVKMIWGLRLATN